MILLSDATYIDYQTLEIKNCDILVTNGNIEFHPPKTYRGNATETINCSGKLVTHSFIVGHHHAYSALARGMGAPKKSPENFYEILKYIWWTLDKCLTTEMVEYSGLVTAMACAKAGATFVIDHHASPYAVKGSLETLAKAFERVGLSHLLCYEISDRDGDEIAQQGLEETDSYLKNYQGLVGLHASFTLSDKTLQAAADLTQKYNSGVHIHVAEDKYDQQHCHETYGKTVVERLSDFNFLNSSKSILVHCLHLSEKERNLIGQSPCWVAQNTDSNLNNNVGYFSSKNLGENIMLGTDGMHSDMLQSMKSAYFVGQNFDPMSPAQAYKRLRNAHHYIAQNGFSGDGPDNLVVLDYDSPTPVNAENIPGHFIYGINQSHIEHVISNGKLIVKSRAITTVDQEIILKESQKLALELWKRMRGEG
ncbi:MAG: amidohydrolase family protein [Tenuifilum sp.]|uniref:amidohydrolase family protein n=1 Tax=Tenuifilum sp. TaxID=2760880 RepID=UPI001B450354|nr:amidohydrolase family protein [Bacteroidales bacterium]HOK60816.1 amidohydrolase family protein [Tenuifilum sp.]HOK86253.1 amidohydrolase family protein [Tenuifilum sp.]HON69965.1 amidohydrolase family protein [Tenuifilum sp.]HOU73498.1 amidohydrolase family protein [Tenuifilum sp.]